MGKVIYENKLLIKTSSKYFFISKNVFIEE